MAKFRHRAWDWKTGVTCVHMLRFHLWKMGHRPEPMPRIRSMVAAKRGLAERGCRDVSDLLDAQPGLVRIAPAQMLLGDLATVPGEDGPGGLGAIFICDGSQKLMGWHAGGPELGLTGICNVIIPFDQLDGAWRA